jgi:3-hydroxybutyryl-CoA dehydrogenase
MGIEIKTIGVIGAGQMGNGIAHVAAWPGSMCAERSERGSHQGRLATINGNLTGQVGKGAIAEADRQAALDRILPAPPTTTSWPATSSSRPRPRTRR